MTNNNYNLKRSAKKLLELKRSSEFWREREIENQCESNRIFNRLAEIRDLEARAISAAQCYANGSMVIESRVDKLIKATSIATL